MGYARTVRVLFAVLMLSLLLLSNILDPFASAVAAPTFPAGFTSEVVVSGLTRPVAVAWASDGRMFIAEKNGVVKVVQNGTLLATPFIDIKAQVNTSGDRGMLGIAVHPQFPTKPYVYLLYTYDPPELTGAAGTIGGPDGQGARVARLLRVEADPNKNFNVARAVGSVVLLGTQSIYANIGDPASNDGPPSCERNGTLLDNCIPQDGTGHTVGTVAFGPDGALYVGNGDSSLSSRVDARALRAQNVDSLAGKVLRIHPETGQGYADNPFYDGNLDHNRSKVYSYGLRNPFRFTFHPHTRELYIGDVGWKGWEEVNVGRGRNFGWPCYEGGDTGNLRQAGYETHTTTQAACRALYDAGASAVRAPLYAYPYRTGTTSGASSVIVGAFYNGTGYPAQYRGALFLADYNRGWLQYLTVDSGGKATVKPFATGVKLVQLVSGPEGDLYYVDYSGAVRRLRYTAGGNTPPTAVASANPRSGAAPLTVQFSSAGTSDPDGDALTYRWGFGDGGTATTANPTYTYANNGTYTATLTVTDAAGNSGSSSVLITVGNTAPVATIVTPQVGTTYNARTAVAFSGRGQDAEDGTVPPERLQWELLLHHNEHVHTDEFRHTGASGSFVTPDHGDDTWLELCLTVTDSTGLQGERCVELQPNRVPYTFQTDPPGLSIVYEGVAQPTPFTANTIVNAQQVVTAPPAPGYSFVDWADGNTQSTRTITVGSTPQTFVARYRATGKSALFVTASTTLNASDAAIKSRLEGMGYAVMVKDQTSAAAADASGKALVLVSSSVSSGSVNTKFRDVPVPVITWEAGLYDDLGMTGVAVGTDWGTILSQSQIAITDVGHPLAAGLSGTVAVSSKPVKLSWGAPNANAARIATVVGDASKAVLFGYDTGAAMPGRVAPARRVGLFLEDDAPASLTANGWQLFDTAVAWATGASTAPAVWLPNIANE